MARTWILPGIVKAPPDWNVDPSASPWNWGMRTQRLFDRVHAHATDAGGDLKFFCRNSHGELTDVLTKDATDSIKIVVQLQMFLAEWKWNGSATLRLQAILKRVIYVNHPKLSETQLTTAIETLLQEFVFTKESHPDEFHHYLTSPEEPQTKAIRRADVQFAHLQWKQFGKCTGLTNGNLNMYFLIYVLDFLDTIRTASPKSRDMILAMHGVDVETR